MNISINFKSGQVKGQKLTPLQTSLEPKVTLTGLDTNKFYTLIMYDRNAGTDSHYYIHWVIVNIPGTDFIKGQPVFKYQGPGPPKGTGQHLYTFVLYLQHDFNESWSQLNNKDKYKSFKDLLYKLSLTNSKIIGNEVKFISEWVGVNKKRSTRQKKRRTIRRTIKKR
jgi:phosphatidylethanolamine-binding protein (PEBP) family uncharacterized protein